MRAYVWWFVVCSMSARDIEIIIYAPHFQQKSKRIKTDTGPWI